MKQFLPFLLILLLALTSTITGCGETAIDQHATPDEFGMIPGDLDEDAHEHGKPVLDPTGWQEPGGKEDALRGRAGLPTSADTSDTAVWEVKNAWMDTDTTAARAQGIVWPQNSGLTWEDKYRLWVESMPRIDRDSYGQTFLLTTPWGTTLPAPALECAEVSMFLRITFASWYNLPFFMEGNDGKGNRLYFGHFGIRTAAGNYANMPRFRTSYRDESAKSTDFINGRIAWPTDPTLAKRKIPGSQDDAQPMLGPDTHTGAYFDRIFLNKRVGYFLLLQLNYMGSINLADTANTYQLTPESILAGDLLVQRWQRTGIGHVFVIMRAQKLGTHEINGASYPQLEAELASGSMPRRQPVWESAAASITNFTSPYSGAGEFAAFHGGVKRFRTATKINGQWTNIVPDIYAADWINSNNLTQLGQRPERFENILTQLSPQQKIDALLEVIDSRRAHLSSYPASCSARTNREIAFTELYKVGQQAGKTRSEIDRDYRKLEDYVFAELDYQKSKTCCWNSSTHEMFKLVMDFNRARLEDFSSDQCLDIVVFKSRDDQDGGFKLFKDYARSIGKENVWRAWRADENCPQASVRADSEVPHKWTPVCDLIEKYGFVED